MLTIKQSPIKLCLWLPLLFHKDETRTKQSNGKQHAFKCNAFPGPWGTRQEVSLQTSVRWLLCWALGKARHLFFITCSLPHVLASRKLPPSNTRKCSGGTEVSSCCMLCDSQYPSLWQIVRENHLKGGKINSVSLVPIHNRLALLFLCLWQDISTEAKGHGKAALLVEARKQRKRKRDWDKICWPRTNPHWPTFSKSLTS